MAGPALRRTSSPTTTPSGASRHRGKIEATLNNAKRAVETERAEGSLAAYFWCYETDEIDPPQSMTTSPTSAALSKDLKKRGWKFVGPTTAFAFMQAIGAGQRSRHGLRDPGARE